MSTTNIYVLSLEGGRYYVGKSHNIYSRYQEHLNGNGSSWTKKYRPVSLVKTLENVSPFEEDKVTKEYMARYGIDKVRGGSYVEVELSEFQREALKKEIWAAKDLCMNCGRAGHWAKNCRARTEVSENRIEYEEIPENRIEYEEIPKTKPTICSKISNEYPKMLSKNGVIDTFVEYVQKYRGTNAIFDIPVGTKYAAFIEYVLAGLARKLPDISWRLLYKTENSYMCRGEVIATRPARKQLQTKMSSGGSCYRCGRAGHYSPDCYANTHSKGYSLDSDSDWDSDSDY